MNLPHFDNAAIEAATPYPELIEAIGEAFRHGGIAPSRHVHNVPQNGEDDSVLLLMPSWNDTGHFGVKLATINAENASRDLSKIRVWGRTPDKAAEVAEWARQNITGDAEAVGDLAAACSNADVISAATLSREALIRGASLRPGTHVDLVGAYAADMRESDAAVFERAEQVFVDTVGGAQEEAGDLLQAINEGALSMGDISGDLHALAATIKLARRNNDEITLFKSVGTGLEDLAAACLCFGAST